MSKEIGILVTKLNKEITEHLNASRSKQQLVYALQKECEHSWEYDYTDRHKGEDYYKCKWCGFTR